MAWEEIDDADDPRVDPYRDLARSTPARRSGVFIAESPWVVERLLASEYEVCSILISRKIAEAWAPRVPSEIPLMVAEEALVREIAGFRFHRGVMACGVRKSPPPLEDLVSRWSEHATVLICPQVVDPENIGGILRSAAAFAVDAVLIGQQSADPFSRRVLRVSMGAPFQIPVVDVPDLGVYAAPLRRQHGFRWIATVLDDEAIPLPQAQRPPRMAILLGHEGYGLYDFWLSQCDEKVMIPMPGRIDSLNVATATSICLYHYSQAKT